MYVGRFVICEWKFQVEANGNTILDPCYTDDLYQGSFHKFPIPSAWTVPDNTHGCSLRIVDRFCYNPQDNPSI